MENSLEKRHREPVRIIIHKPNLKGRSISGIRKRRERHILKIIKRLINQVMGLNTQSSIS